MLRNYIRVAVRNLLKRKSYTLINILGLAVGIACCMLISSYVLYEFSYDSFHTNSDRIYRIRQTAVSPTKVEDSATTPFKVGPTLQMEYDGLIDTTVRFYNGQAEATTLLDRERDISFREEHFYFTDPSVFDVFDIELVRGNSREALSNPLTMVMTEEAAFRYFGEEDPIGKTLEWKGVRKLTITGIMKELPGNSHMKIDILASFSSLDDIYRGQAYDQSWFWNPCWTYILLEEGADRRELQARFPEFVDKYYMSQYPEGETVSLELQPVTDIHLYSALQQEMQPNSSVLYIYIFGGMAVFILIVACINFMNLATARAMERSREVGMRKALGAGRGQLFWQFMGESFLMSFLSVMLAVGFVQLLLPIFNDFLGNQLAFDVFGNGGEWLGLLILFLVVGLSAGLYPATYLSSFQPVRVLKGETTKGRRGVSFRKALVVFQFAFSVILIIGTIVVYMQLQYMQNARLGFDKERVAVMPINQNLIAWEFSSFKELALSHPGILSVTGTGHILGSNEQHFYKYAPANLPGSEASSTPTLYVTHDFLKTYNIELLAGRTFSKEFSTDSEQSILINREMLTLLGVQTPEEALGTLFYFYPRDGERMPFNVIGVVENFNASSIKRKITPLVIRMVEGVRPIVGNISYAAVKIAPNRVEEALQHLEETWTEINFVDPFEFSFHDQELDKIYASEAMMSRISGIFALLCIGVACLGLFGLSSYTSMLKTKEIGIRKTLGASIGNIVLMLSKDYVKLILLANLLAWPVVYYLVKTWLENFPNRIDLGWNLAMILGISLILSLLTCLLTVGYQSFRAALTNPIESIRSE